jgi:hypothetical protein
MQHLEIKLLVATNYCFEEENINNIYGVRNYESTIRFLRSLLFRPKRKKVTVPGETCITRRVLLSECYCGKMNIVCGTKAVRSACSNG